LAIIFIPLAVILPDVTIISAILAMIPWGGGSFFVPWRLFLSLGDYLSRWGDYSRNFGDDPIAEVPFFAPRLLSSSFWRLSFPMWRLFPRLWPLLLGKNPLF
jgi:hypothetical protein